jgi:hypothetical protein
MSTSEAAPGSGDRTGLVALCGVCGVVLVAVLIFALQAVYYRAAERQRQAKVVAVRPEEFLRLSARQKESLGRYGVVDAGQGRYQIPIERAMEAVLREEAARRNGEGAR